MSSNFNDLLFQVSHLLKVKQLKLGLAESFTGGELASTIVSVPGASEYFFEGIVSYSPLSKMFRLGVDKNTISRFNIVSKQVALAMVSGLLQRNYINLAVSTTGYAGVCEEDSFKNGLCYLAIGDQYNTLCLEKVYQGDRNFIRKSAVFDCLEMIYNWIK